jgi:hypothetical protein
MSPTIYLLTICLPLATVLLIFLMKYIASMVQSRARLANDEAYRELAAKATSAQADTARALADLQTRMGALEKILKEVE